MSEFAVPRGEHRVGRLVNCAVRDTCLRLLQKRVDPLQPVEPRCLKQIKVNGRGLSLTSSSAEKSKVNTQKSRSRGRPIKRVKVERASEIEERIFVSQGSEATGICTIVFRETAPGPEHRKKVSIMDRG